VTGGGSAVGGYLALFGLLALSWAGLPTAGQAALIAAGVLASQGDLNIYLVLAVGSVASVFGGVVAYLIGLSGGRQAITAPGPLLNWRRQALARGERLFDRYGAIAVFFVPMWLAGINRMPFRSFLVWNGLAAVAWTGLAGLGGYLVGPAFTDVLRRGSAWAAVAAGVLVIGALAYHHLARRRANEPGGR
jgi:membrane protein DedA with SNARE-associated domain